MQTLPPDVADAMAGVQMSFERDADASVAPEVTVAVIRTAYAC